MVDKYTETVVLPQPPASTEGLVLWAAALIQSLQHVVTRLDNNNIFPLYDAKGRTVINKDGVFVYGVAGATSISPDNIQLASGDIAASSINAIHMTPDSIESESVKALAITEDKLESKTIIVERVSTAQRDISTYIAGSVIYNTTTTNFEGYDGVAWITLTT